MTDVLILVFFAVYCLRYGKNNCLTAEMYSGEITLGKIATLVSNRLKAGNVVCG